MLVKTFGSFYTYISQGNLFCYLIIIEFKTYRFSNIFNRVFISLMLCNLLNQFLNELAIRFNTTKFVKSIVDLCIPNFPEHSLPAIFVYHNGTVIKKVSLFNEIYLLKELFKCLNI